MQKIRRTQETNVYLQVAYLPYFQLEVIESEKASYYMIF